MAQEDHGQKGGRDHNAGARNGGGMHALNKRVTRGVKQRGAYVLR